MERATPSPPPLGGDRAIDGRRCFISAGQIYFGDAQEAPDGTCIRHGQGLQILTARTVIGDSMVWGRYQGSWKEDRISGKGTYRWYDGRSYEGGFLDGRPHGKGKLTWPEGSVYEGAWVEGEMTGQGYFFSGHDGFVAQGTFVRNCVMYDGSWVDVVKRREQRRAERIRIRPPGAVPAVVGPGAAAAGPPRAASRGPSLTQDDDPIPVLFCTPAQAGEAAAASIRTAPYRVPLVLAEESCPASGGSLGSAAPLWCLEQGEHGCSLSTTVHLRYAASEKRRTRDYAQLFQRAIREALLTYRPFCLVFSEDQEENGALPRELGLDEFLEPASLPPDLFDLQHWHSGGGTERFLRPEERSGLEGGALEWAQVKFPSLARAPSPVPEPVVEAPPEPPPDPKGKRKTTAAPPPERAPSPPPDAAPPRAASPPPDSVSSEDAAALAASLRPPQPVVHLLRFALVSLKRLPCGMGEEAVRAHVAHRFGGRIPLHRISVVVVRPGAT